MRRVFAAFLLLAFCVAECTSAPSVSSRHIFYKDQTLQIHSGLTQRHIELSGSHITTKRLDVAGHNLLKAGRPELIVRFRFARPNRQPRGMTIKQADQYQNADDFDVGVKWIEPITIRSNNWSEHFNAPTAQIAERDKQTMGLTLTAEAKDSSPLSGVRVELMYQTHQDHPVIRKSVRLSNHGRRWLVVDQLTIDPLCFVKEYACRTPLTPSERGAVSSVMAFSDRDHTRGVIAVSEAPSALRMISDEGAMGYAQEHFEWVLGPGESFLSEPVFIYGFDGRAWRTTSAMSTPLDRTVEGPYMRYLEEVVGVVAAKTKLHSPTWCTWSNLASNIDDAILREQADLAARCGFKMLLIDDGWQRDRYGTEPHPEKFPDFAATTRYIRSRGLALGLWVSCFRTLDSPDLQQYPNGRSLPFRTRREGYCMSFASKWRGYFAADLVELHRKYGAVFFKQDLTNVKFGDIAVGHESRTAKESLLRGLRGLLESQDLIRQAAPQVLTQLSHEIYWGTPGVPCDVAMIKHSGTYHMPPNDYGGVGHRAQPFDSQWKLNPAKLRDQLLRTCYNSRRRIYDHRGLPAYVLEYYAAHALNFKGSLTPAVQDRQLCSWLGGSPKLFAGDLRSLTEDNIKHYRQRFAMLKRLQQQYNIYKNYQFSGVPHPTDTDWHWWGKLNEQGAGVVVVVRGSGGHHQRQINIPWVPLDKRYHVRALLTENKLGELSGRQLRSSGLSLTLPPMGQEIIELMPTRP